jgi:glucose-1-phosphate adenylyltransferase
MKTENVCCTTSQVSAFILAGGQGERLHPLTLSRPKPAVSFGGMFRIIDFTLFNCMHSGLRKVSLLTQYKYEELHRYIREDWWDLWSHRPDCREPLVCLPPASGKRYRGTADAVFQNVNLVEADTDYVLILSGDHIYEMDYRNLLSQHIETNADLTVAAVEYPLREASHFGVLQVDETSRVAGFDEKPAIPRPLTSNPSMALVNMGVYVFKKSILLGALDVVCGSGQGFDFGHHIIPALIHSVRTYAYDFRDGTQGIPRYWRDIGTIDAYYAASMEVLQAESPFDPYVDCVWPSRAPRINTRAQVGRSVVSPGVVVEENAAVYDSVLMPGARVGAGAQLRRVIVEEGVHVPAGFCAGFDAEHDRNHQTVSEKGVVVIAHAPPGSVSRRRVFNIPFNGVTLQVTTKTQRHKEI